MLDNLRAIAVFASVVECGSFSGAAKSLGITTSAVSQQIRTLENELGVMLLHRSTRKLSLTEAGASLYESAQTMVKAAQDAKSNISELRDGMLGSLRVVTTPILATEHVLPALTRWLTGHSELSLQVNTSSQAVDMIDQRVDVLVDFATTKVGVALMQVKQLLVAAPSYMADKVIDQPKQLAEHAFVLPCANKQLDFMAGQIKVRKAAVTNDERLALEMAKDGYGILCSNVLYAAKALAQGTLVPVLPHWSLPPLTLYAQTPDKNQPPAKIRHCLAALVAYFNQLPMQNAWQSA